MEKYIVDGLQNYIDEKNIPWHMPGHKRKGFNFCGEKTDIKETISRLHHMDVTEVYGLDDLHLPEGMIDKSQRELAKVYGTFASYYLVNGATCGVMTAISACCMGKENEDTKKAVIIAENCHKSVYNTAELLGLHKIITPPETVEVCCKENAGLSEKIYGSVDVEKLEKLCMSHQNIGAMVITSPTYEGIISDVKAISGILKKYGIMLIVDEAHGAHLPFMHEGEEKVKSAIYQGADLVVQSLHKTLPAMTQTALIHVINPALDEAVKKYKQIFMSSSPSYVMLCSMELAVDWAASYEYRAYLAELTDFRKKAAAFKNLKLFDASFNTKNKNGSDTIYAYDITRIVFVTEAYGKTVEEMLRSKGIICEMSGPHYVVLISTPFDSREDFDYLYDVLCRVDERLTDDICYENISDISCYEKISIKSLLGTTAEKNIYVYPPGSYIVSRGEIVEQKHIDKMLSYVESGKTLRMS